MRSVAILAQVQLRLVMVALRYLTHSAASLASAGLAGFSSCWIRNPRLPCQRTEGVCKEAVWPTLVYYTLVSCLVIFAIAVIFICGRCTNAKSSPVQHRGPADPVGTQAQGRTSSPSAPKASFKSVARRPTAVAIGSGPTWTSRRA